MKYPSRSAPFPSDNPSLHRGSSWIPDEVTGPPSARNIAPEDILDLADAIALMETPVPGGITETPDPVRVDRPRQSTVAAFSIAIETVLGSVTDEATPTEPMPPVVEKAAPNCSDTEPGPVEEEETEEEEREEAPPPFSDTTFESSFPSAAEGEIQYQEAPAGAVTTSGIPPAPSGELDVDVDPRRDDPGDQFAALLGQVLSDMGVTEQRETLTRWVLAEASVPELESFEEARNTWLRVLRGEEVDFAQCGGFTLDEWAALVLATLIGSPGRAQELKRFVRERGILAFGLLDAA